MYHEKYVCVIVPAYNEEKMVKTVLDTMPDYVDKIVVVDDKSRDKTCETVEKYEDGKDRILLIRHEKNRGVGAAISTGYIWCRENKVDIAVVMAGDGQMNPDNLPDLLNPIVEKKADYTKGNRLITGEAWYRIPHVRYIGNSILTFLTKIASGYWHVTDSQSGYTALNRNGLKLIAFERVYPRYGMPNDFLVRCNIVNLRVKDVPIDPIYGIGEVSDLKIHRVFMPILILLARIFVRRMIYKYIIRDFHPLVFFYAMGFFMMILDIPLIIRLALRWTGESSITNLNVMFVLLFTILGFQSIFFAMLFDMEANKDLKGD